MTSDNSWDDIPDDDEFDEPFTPEDDPAADEKPFTVVPEPKPSKRLAATGVPRARRELKLVSAAVKGGIEQLTKLELDLQVDLGAIAIDALVCATIDMQFPLDDAHKEFDRVRARALRGELNAYAALATDELEDVLGTIDAALFGLKGLSALGIPLQTGWENLEPVALARKINSACHALFRGRIPGMAL